MSNIVGTCVVDVREYFDLLNFKKKMEENEVVISEEMLFDGHGEVKSRFSILSAKSLNEVKDYIKILEEKDEEWKKLLFERLEEQRGEFLKEDKHLIESVSELRKELKRVSKLSIFGFLNWKKSQRG